MFSGKKESSFHALITRQAGAQKFVSVHVLVSDDWTVKRGHELLDRIEAEIRRAVMNTVVFTHLETARRSGLMGGRKTGAPEPPAPSSWAWLEPSR